MDRPITREMGLGLTKLFIGHSQFFIRKYHRRGYFAYKNVLEFVCQNVGSVNANEY